jgi:hypothetical protein
MRKAIALALLIALIVTFVMRVHIAITMCILGLIALLILKPSVYNTVIPVASDDIHKNLSLDDFDSRFMQFMIFNPDAYGEARSALDSFLKLQRVAGSHQLYTNAYDMRTECINALNSIIISIDEREFVDALGNSISKFDSLLQQMLSKYRDKLADIPVTTSWKPLLDSNTTSPYSASTSHQDNYGWFL